MGIEHLEAVEDEFHPGTILSEKDTNEPIIPKSYGDMYFIGKLWIEVLKTALVGTNVSIFPVVEAQAKPTGPPPKPAPMKYNDLPLYTSPHFEYKDYVENLHKCPKAHTKIIQESLLPHVKCMRQCYVESYCKAKCNLKRMKGELCTTIKNKKNELKKIMRDPDNLMIRRAVVALGTTAGYYLGRGRTIPRHVLSTSMGALSTGALCFPKETDEAFRTLSYHIAKAGLAFYNLLCGKEFILRERLLCKDELPPPPPLRTSDPCASKAKK